MGNDSGTGSDIVSETAACLYYEYTATCESYQNRFVGPCCDMFWNCFECDFLYCFCEEEHLPDKEEIVLR